MEAVADIRVNLLLALQSALLGAVPASLRAVTCDWEQTEIRLRFIFDGEITPGDAEAAQITGTEVVASFLAPWTIVEEVVRLDVPADLEVNALPLWAYRRAEHPAVLHNGTS
jgi:hypothetical protein